MLRNREIHEKRESSIRERRRDCRAALAMTQTPAPPLFSGLSLLPLCSFPDEAFEQELGCLCRMNKRVLCGIRKRAEALARLMICLAGIGSCLWSDMLQIM